jgi:hypothetical protein
VVAMGLVFNGTHNWAHHDVLHVTFARCDGNVQYLHVICQLFVDAKFRIVAKFSIINSLFFEKNQNL